MQKYSIDGEVLRPALQKRHYTTPPRLHSVKSGEIGCDEAGMTDKQGHDHHPH